MDSELISKIYYKCREYMIIQRVLDSFKDDLSERYIQIRTDPYCDMLRVNVNEENWILFFERYVGSREDINQKRGGYIITLPYIESGQWRKNIVEIKSDYGEVKLNVQDRNGVKPEVNLEELEDKLKEKNKMISELLIQQKIDFLIALNSRFSRKIGEINVSFTDGLKELLLNSLNIDLKNHFEKIKVMNALRVTDILEGVDITNVQQEDIEAFRQIIDFIHRCIEASRDEIRTRGNIAKEGRE